MKVIDFSECELSERAGTYGGQAGFKDGIKYNGEYWIIKYPKNTSGMDVSDMSYTTSPLSEFIGSKIYEILGYDVHQTELGVRNNKIVVACKDFCKKEGSLREIRTLKNLANPDLAEKLECSFSDTGSSHFINLEETLLHLKYNDILSKVEGIQERFWDCVVVDIFINNNDRNNGNWGILYEDEVYKLAPIFDNGAAFSNKTNEEKIARFLQDEMQLRGSVLNTTTAYGSDGKVYTSKQMIKLPYKELQAAILRNVPLIESKMTEIRQLISEIPNTYNGLYVCSEQRKLFYLRGMELRLEEMLQPTYLQIKLENEILSQVADNSNLLSMELEI